MSGPCSVYRGTPRPPAGIPPVLSPRYSCTPPEPRRVAQGYAGSASDRVRLFYGFLPALRQIATPPRAEQIRRAAYVMAASCIVSMFTTAIINMAAMAAMALLKILPSLELSNDYSSFPALVSRAEAGHIPCILAHSLLVKVFSGQSLQRK